MKKITCRQMGGVCDDVIERETPEEVMKKGHEHVQNATDEEHKQLSEKMKQLSDEDNKKWEEGFRKTWEETPDA